MDWAYFVLGMVVWQLAKALSLAINRAIIERRQKKFVKLVNITFPHKKQITFIAFDSSDKRAMARLERQVRERFDLPDKEEEEGRPRS